MTFTKLMKKTSENQIHVKTKNSKPKKHETNLVKSVDNLYNCLVKLIKRIIFFFLKIKNWTGF